MSDTASGEADMPPQAAPPSRLGAQLVEHPDFASIHVQPRNITVWLPDGYLPDGGDRYPVIYAHDGQNLFEPGRSYGGVEWGLDETAKRIMQAGDLRPAIIVGIWNTDERWQEYAPQKVIESLPEDTPSEWLGPTVPALKADAYLRFITEELKPFIDATYQTAPQREDTYIMGSSMGGLISLYAMAEYPDTFSRAAAVSIHWPLTEPDGVMAQQADAAMQAYLLTSGLDKTRQTIWFDHGTETLDAAYPPHAHAMEAWFRAQGWTETEAVFRAYPGTDHSEGAWAARADEIISS
ncbi:MAG: alpha/beta hydrolase-fold protein, partial [Pseudomonadota bacterium]